MSRRNIDMTGLTTKDFVANSRRADTYHATIQNNTSQSLTITVTNQNILKNSTGIAWGSKAVPILALSLCGLSGGHCSSW